VVENKKKPRPPHMVLCRDEAIVYNPAVPPCLDWQATRPPPTKNPCVKRKDSPVSLISTGANDSDTGCLLTVADRERLLPSGVQRPPPQSIPHLRCYLLPSDRRLSEARFDDYSSGSSSFVGQVTPTIAEF